MKLTFDIAATEFVTVRDILADILPPECRVWVFGSRAKNQARFNSDLDLALESNGKLPPIILHRLKEAFNEAALAYRVDVLDINDVSENFQTIIRQQAIAFPLAKNDKVPKLRFSEFSGEWDSLGLEKVVELVGGFAFPSQRMSARKTPFQVIKMSNLYAGNLNLKRNASYLDHVQTNEEKFRLANDDILISLTGTVGKRDFGYTVLISNPNGLFLNQRVGMLRVIEGQSVAAYIGALAKTDQFQKKFHALAIGGTGNQANVSLVDCRKLTFKFPTLPEQQKIASFLSSVDTKIDQLTKKKTLLEHYKRGVMQKLFSQELRFKDAQGKAFPEWVEKRLGEVCKVNPKASNLPREFIYIDLESVVRGSLVKESNIQKVEAPSRAQRSLKKGDVLFQMVRPYQKNNYYFDKVGDYVASTGYAQLRAQGSAEFLYQTLHTDSFVNKVLARCTGTSYPAINSSDLEKIHFLIPSIPEQKKIAAFLSAIDQKTDLITTELKHAKTFKKGLLQEMLI